MDRPIVRRLLREVELREDIRAGGTSSPVNKGGRPKGIPNKVTPTVAA